jgi:ribonuclease HII
MLANYHQLLVVEAGLDEAGRGCLAGPVVAAAVVWPPDAPATDINDSKKLTAGQRLALAEFIKQTSVAWAIGIAVEEEIGRLNIYKASMLAMHRAVEQLSDKPQLLLVDGNRFVPLAGFGHVCMVKGDGRFVSIAAASILAKTHRDHLMQHLAESYPQYGWQQNKGYPTHLHRAAIAEFGLTPHHRPGFKHLPDPGLFDRVSKG